MVEVTEVFTPTTPARLTFVERDPLNNQLVDALSTPGKQIVVYGPSGSGKTTLLENKLRQIYESHIITRCNTSSTFESIILSGFDKLNPYYLAGAEFSKNRKLGVGLQADYELIKASITADWSQGEQISVKRTLPLQLTPDRLAEFLGAAKCCWVIEDFHKVPVSEKPKFSQILKTFTDAATDYPSVRIVAIGAVDSARQVVEYEPEMNNRVAEVLVPLMSHDELLQVIRSGERLMNISIKQELSEAIATYSSGLASVCHQLCLNICQAAGIRVPAPSLVEITPTNLQEAVARYLDDSSDTLKSVWDAALKTRRSRRYENCKLILTALVELPHDGGTHSQILSKIRKVKNDYPSGNLTTYLRELCTSDRANILRFDSSSSRYSFSNPLDRAYGLLLLKRQEHQTTRESSFELVLAQVLAQVAAASKILGDHYVEDDPNIPGNRNSPSKR